MPEDRSDPALPPSAELVVQPAPPASPWRRRADRVRETLPALARPVLLGVTAAVAVRVAGQLTQRLLESAAQVPARPAVPLPSRVVHHVHVVHHLHVVHHRVVERVVERAADRATAPVLPAPPPRPAGP